MTKMEHQYALGPPRPGDPNAPIPDLPALAPKTAVRARRNVKPTAATRCAPSAANTRHVGGEDCGEAAGRVLERGDAPHGQRLQAVDHRRDRIPAAGPRTGQSVLPGRRQTL